MFKRVRNWLTKKWKKPAKTSSIAVVKPKDLYSLMNRLRPTCDICNRPVEGMTMISQNAKGETVFIVDCHGDTERLAIGPGEIKGANKIKGGRAFVGKKKGESNDTLRPEDLIPEHRRQLKLPELPSQINRVDE